MRETEFGGYRITERPLENGWYELSTLAFSMGEEWREKRRYDHKPDITDYTRFVKQIDASK